MSVQRKPRPIGPRATPDTPEPVAITGEDREYDLGQEVWESFQSSLSTDEMLDWDDAAGGVIGSGQLVPTMRVMLSMAWIVRRRTEPRLTWKQVRARPFSENLPLIQALVEDLSGGPKIALRARVMAAAWPLLHFYGGALTYRDYLTMPGYDRDAAVAYMLATLDERRNATDAAQRKARR